MKIIEPAEGLLCMKVFIKVKKVHIQQEEHDFKSQVYKRILCSNLKPCF